MTEQHEELSVESGLAKLQLIVLSVCSSTDHVHSDQKLIRKECKRTLIPKSI